LFSNLRTFREFSRDARLLIAASGIISVSFFGVQMLLKLLYVIRLGYGPEYVGWYNATGALVFMAMGLPSGALGARFGTRRVMIAGGIGAVLGMALLPTTEFVPFWAQSVWPFVSQVFLTCGWSLFTVNMVPALTAATTDSGRQHAYALNNALVGLGTFCGTVIGGLLPGMFGSLLRIDLDQAAPYRWALLVGASLGIAALLPLTLIRSSSSGSTRAQVQRRGRFPVLAVVPVLLYIYLRHAGWATCQAFCNAYMDTELRLPTASIGLLTGIGQAIAFSTVASRSGKSQKSQYPPVPCSI